MKHTQGSGENEKRSGLGAQDRMVTGRGILDFRFLILDSPGNNDCYVWSIQNPKSKIPGFTLIELLIGAATLAIAIVALLGAFFGQITLNEHARNITWAINDASRVTERLRQLNTGCATPTAGPADSGVHDVAAIPVAECGGVACASWDVWLNQVAGGGGKSVQPTPTDNELVLVSCRNQAGTAACVAADDPKQIIVAVCWRHRGRILGECAANGAALQQSNGANGFPAGDNMFSSPAMLTTLMTCRS